MNSVDYTTQSDWGRGFTGTISITNQQATDIDGWTLEFRSPHQINKMWNAEILLQEGDRYTIQPKEWNDDLLVGETVKFGFKAKASGRSISREPSDVVFNSDSTDIPDSPAPRPDSPLPQPTDPLNTGGDPPKGNGGDTPKSSEGNANPLWSGDFEDADWLTDWGVNKISFGEKNIQRISDAPGEIDDFLRVSYPAGSYVNSAAKNGRPVGGTQFVTDLNVRPEESMRLSYYLRFSDDFDFVKGGKLPGLYGGDPKSGGDIPDGTDGFSTRFMWRSNGQGEVYAYLPTSEKHGTSLGRGEWSFKPGVWHKLEQEVTLNQPGKKDGQVRVWLDNKPVLTEDNLVFRKTDDLKLDGVFFSTFFGGGDPSWATPSNTHIDFADFTVSKSGPSKS